MVHLSIHSGADSSWSISLARFWGSVLATKVRMFCGVGMRPVKSSVTRRMNSQSVVAGAGVIPCDLKSAQMYESIEPADCD